MEERTIHAYMLFMWNADIRSEFCRIFDGGDCSNPYSIGNHIYNKWLDECESVGRTAAAATLWPMLDESTRSQIVAAAIERYGKECGQ